MFPLIIFNFLNLLDTMDNVSDNDNLLAFENKAFEGADLIDSKNEMESSTTSTIIGGERPEKQMLDSFMSVGSTENDQFNINQNILPQKNKTSIEAILCQEAETHQTIRADSSEISDEELVEYPKAKEVLKISQTNEDLMQTCTSPASQLSDSKNITSSTSAQTIPTSGSDAYITCKSNQSVVNSSSNLTSAASFLTANDKTLSVSHSDSTLSSDSGTLIDERDEQQGPDDQQDQNYEELDITPTKEMPSYINKFTDLKDEEDDDSSSQGDLINRTIISNVIKEPYDTEISLSQLSGSFLRSQTIEQQQELKQSTGKMPRLSLSEQSESDKCSIETAIYRGGESDLSSFESTTAAESKNIRDEQMPSIMSTGNLDQWDDGNLDDEMIVHEDIEYSPETKKSSVDLLYTLEEEEESREENSSKIHQQQLSNLKQHCSSADNSSSLMEFERLEKEVDLGSSTKLLHHSSLDSIGSIGSTGLVSTPKVMNVSNSENASVSSLNEFERLEKEIDQEHQDQSKVKLLTEIEEGHESQASDTIDTISGRSVVKKTKEEEDDTSEIELELNAKLEVDDLTSCPTQQQIVDELADVTPVHYAQLSSSQIDKEESYDEEILKVITTTENKIIEEINESGKLIRK